MTRITENEIELLAIEIFEGLGYDYLHAPDIAPDGDNPERQRYEEVVLVDRLQPDYSD
tara:strand:+ start:8405 stop:8578 length:174 start_codon:yes stop_codon:yes gene_type:complete